MIKYFLQLTIWISLILLPNLVFSSNNIDPKLEKAYSKFISKIERKYSQEKEILILKKLNKKLEQLQETKKLSSEKQKLIQDITTLTHEKLFSIKLGKQITIWNNQLSPFTLNNDFNKRIYSKDNIFLENGIWYTYLFNTYLSFPEWTNIRKEDLKHNKINVDSDLLFPLSNNKPWFSKDYKKVKLISDDIVYGIVDKYELLFDIKDDKISLDNETDQLFIELKEITQEITEGLPKEEKIEKIYKYILDNTQYTKIIDLTDRKIFSWIETYKNKDWVCEWYAKYFTYMLHFADIGDSEVIRGYVIDARDFPQIWHAWVRIEDKYYDPTFDDPVWLPETRKKEKYKYYNLPKDLLYTNRYALSTLPDKIKDADLNYRTEEVKRKLSFLSSKYSDFNYNILKPITFRKKHWLAAYEKFTFEDLKTIIPYYEVDNFKFTRNWNQEKLDRFSYYKIGEDTIDNFLEQVEYDLNWHYLFNWKLSDTKSEYRIAYNVFY